MEQKNPTHWDEAKRLADEGKLRRVFDGEKVIIVSREVHWLNPAFRLVDGLPSLLTEFYYEEG